MSMCLWLQASSETVLLGVKEKKITIQLFGNWGDAIKGEIAGGKTGSIKYKVVKSMQA